MAKDKVNIASETVEEAAASQQIAAAADDKPEIRGATVAAKPEDELVDLFVDRDPSDECPNLLISVNGKNFLMPRGEVSRVPKYIRDEYERSKRAQYKADRTIADMKGIKQAN